VQAICVRALLKASPKLDRIQQLLIEIHMHLSYGKNSFGVQHAMHAD